MSANAYLHIVCLEMKRDFMTLDTLVKWNHVKKEKTKGPRSVPCGTP